MTEPSGAAGTTTQPRPQTAPPSGGWLLGAAIVLAAANLRPAVSSVGPVLADIQAGLGLSGAAAATLTALPLVCFGAGAVVAPRLARRFGSVTTMVAVLAAITVGTVLRIGPDAVTLFAGTVLAGAAIAVANVLMPALVKEEFAGRAGLVMGLYISVTVGGAAVAAALTVPAADAFGGQWRAGLGVWAVPAAVALAVWLVVFASRRRRGVAAAERGAAAPTSLRGDALAWHVTAFMGLQSLGFYAMLSWLPSVYRDHGVSPEAAGQLLSLMVVLGVPTALFFPSLLTRASRQSSWSLVSSAVIGAGVVGLLVAPTTLPQLWAGLLGVGLGAAFPLALTLVVLRSRDARDAAQLSAMSQSVGYAVAAAGPFVFGVLHDATGGWAWPLVFLLVVLVPQAVTGYAAGRDLTVGDRR